MCRENNFSESETDAIVMAVSSSRDQRTFHTRSYKNRRNGIPRTILVVACLIATMAFLSGHSSVVFAHASPTASISSAAFLGNSHTIRGSFLQHRRIEEFQFSFEAAVVQSSNTQDCTEEAGKCTQCTFSEMKTYDACAETGKWQKFKCSGPQEEPEEGEKPRYKMMSCKHTDFENGVAMFQFQIFCVLIGVLSLGSVKKQKKLSLSMFDRRKQQGGSNNGGSSNGVGSNKRNDEEDIEFTPMTNQQRERVPLVARMEVI